VAHHLADDDVRVALDGGAVQAFQRLAPEPVVVVDEVHELAARHLQADVSRPARPPGVRDVPHAHVRMPLGERVEARPGAVGGAVVDEDQLVLAGRHALPE
jgi:hypothetical protein